MWETCTKWANSSINRLNRQKDGMIEVHTCKLGRKIDNREKNIDCSIDVFKLHCTQYSCGAGFIVCLLWMTETQVVWCTKQSIATTVGPSLKDEQHKPRNCDVSRCSVVLITHIVRLVEVHGCPLVCVTNWYVRFPFFTICWKQWEVLLSTIHLQIYKIDSSILLKSIYCSVKYYLVCEYTCIMSAVALGALSSIKKSQLVPGDNTFFTESLQ